MGRFLVALMLASVAQAQEAPPPAEPHDPAEAPTFVGLYGWRMAVWQLVEVMNGADGPGTQLERGEVWGGRLVAGLGVGRFGLEARVDVAGLKEEFSVEEPSTFQTFELYLGAHYVAAVVDGIQVGPVGVVGAVTDERSTEIGANLYGGGVRFGGYGFELHVALALHDYLPGSSGWRFTMAAHVPIKEQLYMVGDFVGGEFGYVRLGVAVRLK